METNLAEAPQNDFTLLDVYELTVSMVEHIVASSNKKLSRKAEVRKIIVDATLKGIGKITEEHLKEIAKSGIPHSEILLPLSIISGTAIEELGKAFAEAIITLSSATDNKLRELLDQSIKAGFELAVLALNKQGTEPDKHVQNIQFAGALIELTRAVSVERSQAEIITVRWMQTLLSSSHQRKPASQRVS